MDEHTPRRGRSVLIKEIAVAVPLALALWTSTYYLLPLPAMPDMPMRIAFAVKCVCIAILLCFLTAIEAVAHERLRSPAIDPLSGYETRRMKINLRYLQNTLEQLMVFIPGLLGLAFYCQDGRAIAATTLVWIVTRIAFWAGYHYGALHRAFGAPGMAQSMLVLLYVSARFGCELAGSAGAAVPLVLFGAAEAFLVYATRPKP